jgi:hypothetical protein
MRIVVFIAALLASLPAYAAAEDATQWQSQEHGGHDTYRVSGLSLTFKTQKFKDSEAAPVLTIRAKGMEPFVFRGQKSFLPASAYFAVERVDPRAPGPQVVLSTYTGGAHCCSDYVLIEGEGTRWTVVRLGLWDGDGLVRRPVDVDGDGIVDLAFGDNRFLYAFDNYALSFEPPQILNVIGGKVVDVSASPRYRKEFESDMAFVGPQCTKHLNGACAVYVADAVRLHRFEKAWTFMLASYDKASTWTLPDSCRKRGERLPCRSGRRRAKNYPEALRWFLEDIGYIRATKGERWHSAH